MDGILYRRDYYSRLTCQSDLGCGVGTIEGAVLCSLYSRLDLKHAVLEQLIYFSSDMLSASCLLSERFFHSSSKHCQSVLNRF